MVVSAVNGVKFNTHKSNITFGGEAEASPKQQPKRASNLVKVPVIVMMTLSPSLLNSAGVAAENYQDADFPQTELLAMATPEPQSTNRTSSTTSNVISSYVRPELVQYKKSFRTENGKQYTMYWVDQNKDVNPNSKGVSSVYLVPSDYKRVNPRNYVDDDNTPPKIFSLVLHDIPGKEFLEAVVREIKCDNNRENKATHQYGIKLPDDIADDIIGLALGKTNYTCNPMLKKSISSTTSSTLTPLKITNFR